MTPSLSVNLTNTHYYGIAKIDEIFDELCFKFDTSTIEITSKYARCTIYPEKRKGKNRKSVMLIEYKVSAYQLAYDDDSFAEWLNERSQYEEVDEIILSMKWKLFDCNIKRCLSFFVKIEDLKNISAYINKILRSRILSASPEIYIEIDINSNGKKLTINREIEVEIFKVETC